MKKQMFLALILSMLCLGGLSAQISNGERETFSKISDDKLSTEDILNRVTNESIQSARKVHTDSIRIKEPLPLEKHSHSDSLNIQYKEFTHVTKRVRLNAEIIEKTFPEIITYAEDDSPIVDYISLTSYLLVVVQDQQKEIQDLKKRFSEIETSSTK